MDGRRPEQVFGPWEGNFSKKSKEKVSKSQISTQITVLYTSARKSLFKR